MSEIKTQIIYKNSKPPYLLGILGFIPFVGAFVGLGLLLYGIFKHKDKKLIIIGAVCILFTVVFYSFIYYEAVYGNLYTEGNIGLSKMNLNSLIKDIEFYKIKHGVYPDSLKQVNGDDKSAWIDDPLLINRRHKSTLFNYKKIGLHYQLFSSGVDGIAYTKDDLYPEIAPADSAKIGYIRR